MKNILTIILVLSVALSASAQKYMQCYTKTNGQGIAVSLTDLAFVIPSGTNNGSVLVLGPNAQSIYVTDSIQAIVDSSAQMLVLFTESYKLNGRDATRLVAVSKQHVKEVIPSGASQTKLKLTSPQATIIIDDAYAPVAEALCAESGGGGGGSLNFGSGSDGQIALWLNDTLRGVDTVRLNQIERATETTPNYVDNGAVPIADPNGILQYSNVADFPADFPNGTHVGVADYYKSIGLSSSPDVEGLIFGAAGTDGNPVYRIEAGLDFDRHALTVLYYAANFNSSGNAQLTNCPSINFMRVRTDNNDSVLVPLKDDPLFQIRGGQQRGLVNSLANPLDNSNGYRAIIGRVDTVLASGAISTRLEFYARNATTHALNGTADGSLIMSLEGESRDIRIPFHTSSRNDSGTPTNFLSTNNLGDLRANPLTDIFPTGTSTLDFGSITNGSYLQLTMSVTGSITGKPVAVTPPPTFNAGLIVTGLCTSSGTITITVYNATGAPVDPDSGSFTATQINI